MSMQPAARVTDRLGHAPTPLVGGVSVAAGQGSATEMTSAALATLMGSPDTGALVTGSANVFINTLPAMMVQRATGLCAWHVGTPIFVTSGSGSVFINGQPAARVTSQMNCTAMVRTGSPNVFIGGPTASLANAQTPLCAGLRSNLAALERFRIDAQAADGAYQPPGQRTPPEGYRNAGPEDLRRLGLTKETLEHPIDPRTGKKTEFRAAVFIDERTGAPLVAYKGTTQDSREDWLENYKQNRGQDSFYYRRAQDIARKVSKTPGVVSPRFAGHSLGGGMASAASRATGRPGTTFNSAGLHANTVAQPQASEIDAVYVEGEVLRNSQSIWGVAPTAATQTWPLQPADLAAQPPPATGLRRAIALHGMKYVRPAIAAKRAEVEAALIANACP